MSVQMEVMLLKSPLVSYALVCTVCNQEFVSRGELQSHCDSNHNVQLDFQVDEGGDVTVEEYDARQLQDPIVKDEAQSKVDQHMCSLCGKTFRFLSYLKRHMKVHSNYEESSETTQFLVSNSVDKRFDCVKCDKKFHTTTSLKKHENVHFKNLSETQRTCNTCGKGFPFISYLKRHEKIHFKHSKDYIFKCGTCRKDFKSVPHLKFHEEQEHSHIPNIPPEENFACETCGKVFKYKSGLRAHQNTHTNRKLYHCDICRSSFTSSTSLKNHYYSHYGEKPFQCKMCGKCFIKNQTLVQHMRLHTGDLPYQCPDCDRCFNTKSLLQNHSFIHTGKYPFTCEKCHAGFRQKTSFKKHIESTCSNVSNDNEDSNVIDGTKITKRIRVLKYSCGCCGKMFKNKASLEKHQSSHTGKYKFQCNICEIGFIQKMNFLAHFKRHSTELKETGILKSERQCDVCGKRFKARFHLRIHYRVHTGNLPFSCEFCGKKFNAKFTMKNHVSAIHTKNFPFVCIVCGKGYVRKYKLQRHLGQHCDKIKN